MLGVTHRRRGYRFDGIDTGMGRASPNRGEKLFRRGSVARDQELNAPVRAVLHPAGQPQRVGAFAHEPPKPDALDSSGNP